MWVFFSIFEMNIKSNEDKYPNLMFKNLNIYDSCSKGEEEPTKKKRKKKKKKKMTPVHAFSSQL